MNREVPIKNHGKTTMYVGGCLIPPGETRILPSHRVPAHLPQPKAPAPVVSTPSVDDVLRAMLTGNVASVRAGLPQLSDEHLALLEALEQDSDGANRKGVLEAIGAERLARASRAHLAEFAASLEGLDEDGLLDKLDEVQMDLDKAEIVQAAIDALHPGAGDGQSTPD